MSTALKVGLLTASDRSFRGEREDASGAVLSEFVRSLGGEVTASRVLPDDRPLIAAALRHLADVLQCDLVLTTGGTGLAPRDVTPEATRDVLEKEVPGIAEALRAAGLRQKPAAMLSRGLAGVRGRTLIINLPGSPEAVAESLEVLRPVLEHAILLLKGEVKDCQTSFCSPHSHSSSR